MTETRPKRNADTKMVPVPSHSIIPERDIDKMPVLECQHLGIDFGGLTAVEDFNLTIGKTEIAGLIGPNGAGKTTVFNLLTKVYEPTRGTSLINGIDMHGMDTVTASKHGIARTKKQHEKAMELLSIFGMQDIGNTVAGSLPYGAQRRLEIVRALATDPKLLLLDEPAAGMNPHETEELMDNIIRIRDQFQIAILLIEHDMNLVGLRMSEHKAQDLPLLKVNDLHVYYGAIHAVKGISLEVREGEIVTLIGANGAGKSTTLNTIAGLLKPRQGSIVLAGIPVDGTSASKMVFKGLSLCPEGRRIFQQMTVRENLEMGAYSRPNEEIEASLEDVFKRFPRLKEREKQIGGTLSGGEQQMLAMARALMSKPKLMMLDEPSMGLAPILVDQIFDIIKELHQSGVTILLVEQNAQMALSVADRAYVLETGRIAMSGNAADLLQNDAVQKAYLGN